MTAAKYTGTESVRSRGGLWGFCEGKGSIPGGRALDDDHVHRL